MDEFRILHDFLEDSPGKNSIMKKKIKTYLKNTSLYYFYRNRKMKRYYAQRHNINSSEMKKYHVFRASEQDRILDCAKIKNIAFGDFFYSIDTKIIFDKLGKRIIDNMPVDYDYVINNCLITGLPYIESYAKRIHDSRVKLSKPTTLKEALQSILFWNGLLWQTGHTLVGLGRLDKVLESYPITDETETLLMDFLKTLHCAYDFKSASLRGDTGQIIILGGLNEDGTYFCNDYTALFIKCIKNLNIPDPKILLRCSKNMPQDLLRQAVDCVATGIGCPLFSNDDIVIPKLVDFGYEQIDAYNYGVSACWEPLSIGNSLEQNNLAHIPYGKCVHDLMCDSRFVECKTFKDILQLYSEKLSKECYAIVQKLNKIEWSEDSLLTYMMGLNKDVSLGTAKYNNYGILSVGMSSAVNSLLNIKKYVFDEKIYTLSDIQKKIESNQVDEFAENNDGFGTESMKAIELTNYLIRQTEMEFKNYRNKFGGKVKFGLSSPSYITIGKSCGATLDGRKEGEPFQTHISRDKGEPITEIMNFESKLEFSGISCNANVIDVMVQSSLIKDSAEKFTSYVMGGIKEGIFQLQMNVLSYDQLVDAKVHPEKYPNLIVRVWGFSAYFNDLPEEYKDNLIRRAKEMEQVA